MENNNFEYIRSRYSVPAEYGRRIHYKGRTGIIVKDLGSYIGVTFDDEKPTNVHTMHPTYRIKYMDLGQPRKLTASQQRYQDYLDADSGLSFIEWVKRRNHGK